MTKSFVTRAAVAADSLALVALVNSAYRGDSSRVGWTTEADLLDGQRIDIETLSETLAKPGNVILLHEIDRAVAGCVHLERTNADCYLGMLTIRPTAQGTGLGRQMLEAAEHWAVEHWSSQAIHMTVIVQRIELIRWYQGHGYRRTGERKPFPYGDERFGQPRRDDLEFEVLHKPLSAF